MSGPGATAAEGTERPLFRTRQIAGGVWQLSDVMGCRAYLVCGQRRAALVDAMGGLGDPRLAVRSLTALPVTVLLTHHHYDHVSGAYFFSDVRLPAGEGGCWDEEAALGRTVRDQAVDEGLLPGASPWFLADGARPNCEDIREGDVIDLGGLTLEAVGLSGHTAHSMGYLVRERRLLLSGDAVTPIMCLFFDDSLPVSAWRETLCRMGGLPFDEFWTGHHGCGFSRESLAEWDEMAGWVLGERDGRTPRGIDWMETRLPQFTGTVYLFDNGVVDVDSPRFRALIGPHVPHEPRRRRRHAAPCPDMAAS